MELRIRKRTKKERIAYKSGYNVGTLNAVNVLKPFLDKKKFKKSGAKIYVYNEGNLMDITVLEIE
jgi:hypothetical protein